MSDTPAETPGQSDTRTATAIGFVAVLLWALLALLTASTGTVPPFQLTAMSFTVASLAGLGYWIATGADIAARLRLPPAAWLLGTGGLFGYHFFYFLALRNAPPVEASLIAYLWPLLIVLLSALLPGAAGVCAGGTWPGRCWDWPAPACWSPAGARSPSSRNICWATGRLSSAR